MKKLLLLIAASCYTGLSFAQSPLKIVISSGTRVVMTNSVQATFSNTSGTPVFTNDGSYTHTDNSGKLNDLCGVIFTGSGTTTLYDLGVSHASGTTLFNSLVSVKNTATLALGALNANNNLFIRSDLGNATMVNNGSLANNVQGLIAKASATTGGCPSYGANLSLNISGTHMKYQWQTSSDGSTGWTDVSGATNATYAATVTQTIYYRCNLGTDNTVFTESTPAVQLDFTGTYPSITLGTSPSVIQGATSAQLPYLGTGGSPDHYNIYYSAAAHTAGFTDEIFTTMPLTSPINLTVPAAASPAVYTGTVTVENGCVSAAAPFTVTVTAPLSFTGGPNQSTALCEDAAATSINSLMAISDPGAGLTETWSVISGPGHGSVSGFPYSTSSNGGVLTPAGLTYTPGTGYSGNDVFTIRIFNGSLTATTSLTVTVNPLPTVNAGSALSAICQGATTAVLDGSFGGSATAAVWSDGGAGGSFANNSGSTPGAATYTAASLSPTPVTLTLLTSGGACGTTSANKQLVVNPNPTVGVGSGPGAVCLGGFTATLGGTFGGGATLAIWSDNGAGGSFTGNGGTTPSAAIYTASSASVATVTLTLTTGGGSCGTIAASKNLTVNPNPAANAGSALSPICQGSATTDLGGSFGGGATAATWSDNSAGGSFTGNGGTTPGTAIYTAATSSISSVTLTLTTSGGSCGATSANKVLVVNLNPTVNVGGAPGAICQGTSTAALNGSFGGGATAAIWDDGGAGGLFSNNTGSTPASAIYTASAGSSSPVTLTLTTSGGSCGATSDFKSLTVNQSPTVDAGAAVSAICQGQTTGQLGGSFGGGATAAVWSDNSAGGSFANNSGSTPGTVTYTASSSSISSVTLTLTSSGGSCGMVSANKVLTVNQNPAANVGGAVSSICQGGTTAALGGSFSGSATSAIWSDGGAGGSFSNNSGSTPSSATYTASASSSSPVTLTLTTSGGLCGTLTPNKSLTVNPTPVISSIDNDGPTCAGLTLNLSASAGGGTGMLNYSWSGPSGFSATQQNPSISSVTASADGTYTLVVSDVNSCSANGITTATIRPTPAIIAIGNNAPVCEERTLALFSTVAGGSGSYTFAWTGPNGFSSGAEDPTVATSATAAANGVYTLVVTDANTCTATGANTTNVTVYPIQSISGATSVFFGQTITLSDPVTGGTWSTPTPWTTSVTAAGGAVKGISAGISVISYTTTQGCVATTTVTVISGVNACVGQTITLSNNGVPGGTWSSGTAAIATINATTGVLTGVSAGKVVVTYRTSPTAAVTTTVTVNPLLPTNMSATTACQGQSIALTNTTVGGGTWYSGNTSVAVVTATGSVSGLAGGIVNIYFTPVAGCVTVKTLTITAVSPIIGPSSVCVSSTISLSNETPGGTWYSSSGALATVTVGGGVVLGVAAGRPAIFYIWPNGCWASSTIMVNPLVQTTTSSTGIVCQRAAITYNNTTLGGGAWTISNTNVATVSSSGVVTGAGGGVTSLLFTTPAGCVATRSVTVNGVPVISGIISVCMGQTTQLSSSTTGGIWSSSSGALASVSTSGLVKGVASGSPRITYTMPTGCNSSVTVTVNTLNAITGGIPGMCQNNSMTLANSTPFGGAWSSSNTGIATVSSGGVVRSTGVGVAIISFTSTVGSCVATRTVTVNACRESGATSVSETEQVFAAFKLFPNPNNGVFTLQGIVNGNADILAIEVINIVGQTIYSAQLHARNGQVNEQISLGDKLARGSYMLKLHSDAGSNVFHFVVN